MALALALVLAALPARGGTNVLLIVEVCTVTLILIVTVVVLVKLLSHSAPGGSTFTWSVFSLDPGTSTSALFLGVVFGFLSFAGFEASATLGEEARNPTRDIPRAILGVAIFGGIYFVVVTAVEVMGFGTSAKGLKRVRRRRASLLGDLGTSYVGSWVGDLITAGTTISAFGCCLACTVGAARMIYAMSRDSFGERGRRRGARPVGHPGRRDRRGDRHGRHHLRGLRRRVDAAVVAGGQRVLLVGDDRHADPARRLRARGHRA